MGRTPRSKLNAAITAEEDEEDQQPDISFQSQSYESDEGGSSDISQRSRKTSRGSSRRGDDMATYVVVYEYEGEAQEVPAMESASEYEPDGESGREVEGVETEDEQEEDEREVSEDSLTALMVVEHDSPPLETPKGQTWPGNPRRSTRRGAVSTDDGRGRAKDRGPFDPSRPALEIRPGRTTKNYNPLSDPTTSKSKNDRNQPDDTTQAKSKSNKKERGRRSTAFEPSEDLDPTVKPLNITPKSAKPPRTIRRTPAHRELKDLNHPDNQRAATSVSPESGRHKQNGPRYRDAHTATSPEPQSPLTSIFARFREEIKTVMGNLMTISPIRTDRRSRIFPTPENPFAPEVSMGEAPALSSQYSSDIEMPDAVPDEYYNPLDPPNCARWDEIMVHSYAGSPYRGTAFKPQPSPLSRVQHPPTSPESPPSNKDSDYYEPEEMDETFPPFLLPEPGWFATFLNRVLLPVVIVTVVLLLILTPYIPISEDHCRKVPSCPRHRPARLRASAHILHTTTKFADLLQVTPGVKDVIDELERWGEHILAQQPDDVKVHFFGPPREELVAIDEIVSDWMSATKRWTVRVTQIGRDERWAWVQRGLRGVASLQAEVLEMGVSMAVEKVRRRWLEWISAEEDERLVEEVVKRYKEYQTVVKELVWREFEAWKAERERIVLAEKEEEKEEEESRDDQDWEKVKKHLLGGDRGLPAETPTR